MNRALRRFLLLALLPVLPACARRSTAASPSIAQQRVAPDSLYRWPDNWDLRVDSSAVACPPPDPNVATWPERVARAAPVAFRLPASFQDSREETRYGHPYNEWREEGRRGRWRHFSVTVDSASHGGPPSRPTPCGYEGSEREAADRARLPDTLTRILTLCSHAPSQYTVCKVTIAGQRVWVEAGIGTGYGTVYFASATWELRAGRWLYVSGQSDDRAGQDILLAALYSLRFVRDSAGEARVP